MSKKESWHFSITDIVEKTTGDYTYRGEIVSIFWKKIRRCALCSRKRRRDAFHF